MSNGSGFLSAFNSVMANTGNTDILTGVTTLPADTSGNQGSYMCVGNLLINFNNRSTGYISRTSTFLEFAYPYTDTPYSVIATNYDRTLPLYSVYNVNNSYSGITFDATTSIANVQFIAIGPRPSTLS